MEKEIELEKELRFKGSQLTFGVLVLILFANLYSESVERIYFFIIAVVVWRLLNHWFCNWLVSMKRKEDLKNGRR